MCKPIGQDSKEPDQNLMTVGELAARVGGIEFSFLSQRTQRAAFRGSITLKTPVLKLKCLFACKPPAAIGSESTQVAFKQFAKPQVACLHC